MTQFSHTPEAWAALATNPEDRSEAVSRMAESVGGRVLSFHFSFGDYDGVTISEAPYDKTAATIALVAASTGHLKNLKTTTLFSVDETMEVLRRVGEISYQGAGPVEGGHSDQILSTGGSASRPSLFLPSPAGYCAPVCWSC